MTVQTNIVFKKDYDLIGILDGDIDVVEEMFDQSGYLCDAISSVADGNIPIYNGEIWEGASSISEYIEDAIAEGIAPVSSGDVDLIKIFQAGYYQYYSQLLYDNLETFTFNYVADKINEYLNSIEDTSKIDVEAVASALEDAVGNIDNNDTFDDMNDVANEIIEDIKNEEYPI